ncbi:MAG: aminotransferase class V-fold PLP-dependent enzyme, partial [Gemmatimonadota bacterium]
SGPEYSGGGTVDIVTMDEVYWAGLPDREESGSPNIIGAIAMAAAAKTLMEFGMDAVAAHEDELIAYTLKRLRSVHGTQIYGQADPAKSAEKVGVVPFNVGDLSHFLVAAVLGYEYGIGVRNGCFCAHPYVVHLLDLPEDQQIAWRQRALQGDKSALPGMVRASFGCYNNEDDVDQLVDALDRISRGDFKGQYQLHLGGGDLCPKGYKEPFDDFFLLQPYTADHEIAHGACGN